MAQNIKPPSGQSVDGVANQGQAGQAAKTGGAAFKEALNRAATSTTSGASQVQEMKGAQKIAADLKAGRIDSARAVEQLITERLQSPSVAHLSPAGKAALEAHLRSKVTTDPTLLSLISELEGSEKQG